MSETILVFISIILGILGILGVILGTRAETARLYDKCLVEMQNKPYKEATELCKERVK